MTKNEQKIKTFILKMKEENGKFKEKIGLMKSQVEELKELRKTTKAQESTKRKWMEKLFHYKQ